MATLMYRSTELAAAANEASIKTEVLSILIPFTLLSILAVVFRLWARYRCTGFYGWDDWLVIVSLVLCLTRMALSVAVLELGLGWKPNLFTDTSSLTPIVKILFADAGLYYIAMGIIKMSILIMYYRVFPLRGFKIATWIVGGTVGLWTFGCGMLWLFQCRPISHAWNPMAPGMCLSIRTIVLINTVPRILLDVTILIMPVVQVWLLQMPLAQKRGLTCIFLLGSFVLIPSIWRLIVVTQNATLLTSESLKSFNEWGYIEVCVALISACLPTIRPLLTAFSGLSGFGWSHHVRGINGSDSESAVSNVQQPNQETEERNSDVLLLKQPSDLELVVEQSGPRKGMVVMVAQIVQDDASSSEIRRNNDDLC